MGEDLELHGQGQLHVRKSSEGLDACSSLYFQVVKYDV